ncbi:MAG: carboxypeptidase Q [Rhodothermales bacterium]|jgi:carboxypeptidase Q
MPRSLLLAAALLVTTPLFAQTFQTEDPVIRDMWRVGVEESQTRQLAHVLMDQIGPRLAGSEGLEAAQDWLLETYDSWGIEAEKQEIGTWMRWKPGSLHIDMVSPRVTSLEAEIKAWSPGTNGPVRGTVVLLPAIGEDTEAWLAGIKGKFVMISAPEEMCRAKQELEALASPGTIERLAERKLVTEREAERRMLALTGPVNPREIANLTAAVLDKAGAAGTIESRWSGGWGVNKVFGTNNTRAVAIDVSCEDYGLMYRLISGGDEVEIEVDAQAELQGEVPQFNVVAQLTGTELPNEYVLLGAHLDSWHAATGATDNGTGSITMLEAMRILKATYPNPRRTILVGHWANEEAGLIGSSAFREDHPEMLDGIQAAFNQDNGTWAFERIEGQGFADAASHIPAWAAAMPKDFSDRILLEMPGPQANSGSDHSSFVCAGIPSFRLQSPYNEYRQYTWHTNRDTYDKIVFDDLADNATVAAMMAYMASEDPTRVGREKATLPQVRGPARSWPECRPARRTSGR